MARKVKRIALFGGSFNPPHLGHVAVARRLARRRGFDAVWVVPAYRHPFGKPLAPFALRLKLARLAFGGLGRKVRIVPVEARWPRGARTVELLAYLRRRHPRWAWTLVIGADAWRERKRWKDFPEIQRLARVLVIPRGLHSPIPNVSSTALRRALRLGRRPRGLPRAVFNALKRGSLPGFLDRQTP